MAGMIQDAMQPAAPQGAAPAPSDPSAQTSDTPPSSGGSVPSPNEVMGQLHLTPDLKPQLQRIVVAGMKVMFDAKTHQMMLQQLQGPGALADKLGQGIAGLMGLLQQESKNSLNPMLLVPAGLVLLAHAADYLNQTGVQVSPQDYGGAVENFVDTVLQQFKLDPNKVAAVAGDAEKAGDQGAAEAQEAPSAPDEQE